MEELRLRLEDRFEAVPGEVTVVVHTNPALLALAHPFLPAARWSAAPAGRRYLAGWAMATELHVLNDPHMERRAAGEDSREALRGTAERLYAQLVIAANNPDLPPPGRRAASPATSAGPGWSRAPPSTSPARSASTARR